MPRYKITRVYLVEATTKTAALEKTGMQAIRRPRGTALVVRRGDVQNFQSKSSSPPAGTVSARFSTKSRCHTWNCSACQSFL